MKIQVVLVAVLALVNAAPVRAYTDDQIEDILDFCNATMPTPNPSAHDFYGSLDFVEIPNADIAYYRFGNASTGLPAIVMVMGFGGTMAAWPLDLLYALALEQEVVIFDNRGQGLSKDTNYDVPITIPGMANDTVNFVTALELDIPPNLMGWSMGGMITTTAMALYGDYFNRFVIMAGTAGGLESQLPGLDMLSQLMGTENVTGAQLLNGTFPVNFPDAKEAACTYALETYDRPSIPSNATTTSRQLKAIISFWTSEEILDMMNTTERHALIFGGEYDYVVPPQNQKLMAQLLPHPWLVVFSDGGHGSFIQHWQTVHSLVRVFLTGDPEDA